MIRGPQKRYRGNRSRGVAQERKSEGIVVVLVSYLDDSGTDKRASVVTMAGYVASLKDWRRFESRARQFLRREKVELLHAKEFQDRAGSFRGWGVAKQLAFVTES